MHDRPPCCIGDERPEGCTTAVEPPEGFALGAREWAVVQELGRGDDARVGFQGLRRRLELHQETLSRVLRRLEASGYVQKDAHGYRLTGAGSDLMQRLGRPIVRPHTMTVASALVPSTLGADAIRDALAGRWFGELRWYGMSEGPGETVLSWLDRDGSGLYRLRVGGGAVRVEVASRHADPDPTLTAAAPLVAAVATLLQKAPNGTRSRRAS